MNEYLEGGRGEWGGETGGCLPLLSRYPARGRGHMEGLSTAWQASTGGANSILKQI